MGLRQMGVLKKLGRSSRRAVCWLSVGRVTPTRDRESLYNKVKLCIFRPAGRFRDGLARKISAPLAPADGESTGDPPVASLALALAPWPARRDLQVEKIESGSRVAPPSPPCRAGDVKPALRQSHPRKNKVQSIPYMYPMSSDLLYDSSTTPRTRARITPIHVHSPYATAEHTGWLPVRDDAP